MKVRFIPVNVAGCLAALVMLSSLAASKAAVNIASDNAGNYTSAWSGNGGSGFGGAWSFSNTSGDGGQNGSFLATTSGNPDLSIATSGKGWGLYANNGQTANAVRTFSGGTLAVGQSILLSMDNGGVDTGGTVGFGLQNSSGVNRFEFYFKGGLANYKINNGTESDTGFGFTSSGLNLVFTETAGGYSFTINGGSAFTGSLAGTDISQVRFFDFNSGGGNNVYFNNLQAVPEPMNVALGIFGGLALTVGVLRNVRHLKFSRQVA